MVHGSGFEKEPEKLVGRKARQVSRPKTNSILFKEKYTTLTKNNLRHQQHGIAKFIGRFECGRF